jgi:hypothetical protein
MTPSNTVWPTSEDPPWRHDVLVGIDLGATNGLAYVDTTAAEGGRVR